jgi:hypothetical protein
LPSPSARHPEPHRPARHSCRKRPRLTLSTNVCAYPMPVGCGGGASYARGGR